MPALQLSLRDNRTAFSPGETIDGTAAWQLDSPPKEAGLYLTWSTKGKGSEDIEVVTTVPFSNPQASDTRPFTLKLPDAPYTFSGQLISLDWVLELIIDPGDHSAHIDITLAPDGREVLLPRIKPV